MSYLPFIKKRARWYHLRIGRNKFFKKSSVKFPLLHHLHYRRDILTIIAPNHMRSNPMETRHPDISRDTKLEEIWAPEDLQKAAQKQHPKEEKAESWKWVGKGAGLEWCFINISPQPPIEWENHREIFPKHLPIPILPHGKITNKNQQKFPKNSFFLFFFNLFSKSTFSLLENLSKTQKLQPPAYFLLQEIIGEFLKPSVKVRWCSFFHSYNILLFEIETFLYKTMRYLDRVCNSLRKISTISTIRDIIA